MSSRASTAIVVTFNSANHISATLSALCDAPIDVVVVDNASSDASTAIVRRDFPEVRLIEAGANLGFAGAVNRGLAGIDADIVLLVNPDCTLPPATAIGLIDYLASHPGVGVVGPRLVDRDGTVAISAHPFESFVSVAASRFGGSIVPVAARRLLSGAKRRATYDTARGTNAVSVDWVSGACLAVRADLLRALGGLDERYFLYYEDEELCWQARRCGVDVVHLGGLSAQHVGGASSAVGETWPHLYRSMLVFFAMHRPASYTAVRLVVLLRAGIGVGTATMRRAAHRPTGAARATAWRRVASVAWAASRRDLLAAAR